MRLQISQGEYTVFSDDIFVGFRAYIQNQIKLMICDASSQKCNVRKVLIS